jgi:transcriptional regulatory protein LevR
VTAVEEDAKNSLGSAGIVDDLTDTSIIKSFTSVNYCKTINLLYVHVQPHKSQMGYILNLKH